MNIFHNNLIDSLRAADLTPSTEDTNLTADNVLDPQWSKSWLTTTSTSHTLAMDFGTAQDFTSAVVYLKASQSITAISVDFDDNDSFSSPTNKVLASSAPSYGIALTTFDTVSERYARLNVTLATPGTINVYRLHLGGYFDPANTQIAGGRFTPINQSRSRPNQVGDLFTDVRPVIIDVRFSTSYINAANTLLWANFVRDYGINKHMFLAMYETDHTQTQTVYGQFTKTGDVVPVAIKGNNLFNKNEGWRFRGVRQGE